MAVFVRKFKKAERLELSHLLHSREDSRVVRRAQMILQSSQGIKVPATRGAYAIRRMLPRNGRNNCRQREFIIDVSHVDVELGVVQ